jgi:hypothetical protein
MELERICHLSLFYRPVFLKRRDLRTFLHGLVTVFHLENSPDLSRIQEQISNSTLKGRVIPFCRLLLFLTRKKQ